MSSYIFKPGDTLYDISQKTGIELEDLIQANPHLEDPNQIMPGESLNLPREQDRPPLPPQESQSSGHASAHRQPFAGEDTAVHRQPFAGRHTAGNQPPYDGRNGADNRQAFAGENTPPPAGIPVSPQPQPQPFTGRNAAEHRQQPFTREYAAPAAGIPAQPPMQPQNQPFSGGPGPAHGQQPFPEGYAAPAAGIPVNPPMQPQNQPFSGGNAAGHRQQPFTREYAAPAAGIPANPPMQPQNQPFSGGNAAGHRQQPFARGYAAPAAGIPVNPPMQSQPQAQPQPNYGHPNMAFPGGQPPYYPGAAPVQGYPASFGNPQQNRAAAPMRRGRTCPLRSRRMPPAPPNRPGQQPNIPQQGQRPGAGYQGQSAVLICPHCSKNISLPPGYIKV